MSYFGFLLILILNFAWAHQSSKTVTDKDLKWNYSIIPIRIEDTNTSGINAYQIIQESIQEWNNASALEISPSSNASNHIKFSNDFSIYGSAVIGITEVSYGTTGVINTATIILNEDHYNFKDTPGIAFGNTVYLKDVVTHELGHLLGLGHSEVLDASMFYANFPGQSDLSDDDVAGIRHKYSSGLGKVSGYIQGGHKVGVLGVHVQLISRSSGKIVSGISDETGYFEIGGLNLNETYYLYTSPLKKTEAISTHYSNVQSEFCPSSYLGSFFSPCGRQSDGLPQGINLSSDVPEIDLGVITINCSLRTQADYTFEKLQSSFNPITIFDYAKDQKNEKSYVGFFRSDELTETSFTQDDHFIIDLSGVSLPAGKVLDLKLISQPLGHPIEYEMEVHHSGTEISGSPFKMETISPAGTLKLDVNASKALSVNPSQNIFELKIKARKLSYDYAYDEAGFAIPDFQNFASKTHYPYLIIASLKQGLTPILDTGSVLSDNASCLDAPFTYAVKKTNDQSLDATTAPDSEGALAAACATIDLGDGPGPGNFMMLLSMGFLFSLFALSLVKRAKNFLS